MAYEKQFWEEGSGECTECKNLERENEKLRVAQKGNLAKLDELNEAIANVWKVLGITVYTGKHIAEHVAELKEQLAWKDQQIKDLRERHNDHAPF